MMYLKVEWLHLFPNEPVIIYSEIDDNRWEIRKIEIYKDGELGFSDSSREYRSMGLSETQIPSFAEIELDPEFKPSIVSKAEFDELWSKAIQCK